MAKQVLTWAKHSCTRVWWGQGAVSGSFVPEYDHNGVRHQLFATYTYGTLEIYFQHYSRKPPFDSQELRLEMVRRLNQVPGVSIPDDAITRRPTVKLAALVDHNSTVELLAVFDWYLEQIRRA